MQSTLTIDTFIAMKVRIDAMRPILVYRDNQDKEIFLSYIAHHIGAYVNFKDHQTEYCPKGIVLLFCWNEKPVRIPLDQLPENMP